MEEAEGAAEENLKTRNLRCSPSHCNLILQIYPRKLIHQARHVLPTVGRGQYTGLRVGICGHVLDRHGGFASGSGQSVFQLEWSQPSGTQNNTVLRPCWINFTLTEGIMIELVIETAGFYFTFCE